MSTWGHHTYLYVSKASISEAGGTCGLAAPIPNVTVNQVWYPRNSRNSSSWLQRLAKLGIGWAGPSVFTISIGHV